MSFEEMLTSDGYMQDPSEWSQEFALWRLESFNLEATPERLQAISWMRSYIEDSGITPASGVVIRKGGKINGWDSKSFYAMFPLGPKQLAMVCGGIKPSGC